jgi:hypothetical protein
VETLEEEPCDYCGQVAECGETCHGTRACGECFREADAAEEYDDA